MLQTLYPWIKSLHLIAVIAWMAGIMYLPRLFVYHANAAKNGEAAQTFVVMERRLLRGIMNPAMIVTWLLGLVLAYQLGDGAFKSRVVSRETRPCSWDDGFPYVLRPVAPGA